MVCSLSREQHNDVYCLSTVIIEVVFDEECGGSILVSTTRKDSTDEWMSRQTTDPVHVIRRGRRPRSGTSSTTSRLHSSRIDRAENLQRRCICMHVEGELQ